MTREEFIEVLKEKSYSYRIEGDRIVITHTEVVNLISLTSLPSGVVFKNGRSVYLQSLTILPPGVVFKNERGIYLESLIGGWFDAWKGNIRDIESTRLFNLMLSKGLFAKSSRGK
jgi:hypothetical protein